MKQHNIKWNTLDANALMHLRHDIWFKLTKTQQYKLRLTGYDHVNLDEIPMHIFKTVTKAEYLHERLTRLKRGSFRLIVYS